MKPNTPTILSPLVIIPLLVLLFVYFVATARYQPPSQRKARPQTSQGEYYIAYPR